jgi:hypothetical protein
VKLLGRDIPARELVARIEERLQARGLLPGAEARGGAEAGGAGDAGDSAEGQEVEAAVDPWRFHLGALEEHADPTRPLPLETHRGGPAGRLVLLAKWAFRKGGQVLINEALARQRLFNGHVYDGHAQLTAEVLRLRAEVEQLRAAAARPPTSAPGPAMPAATATPAPVAPASTAPASTAPAAPRAGGAPRSRRPRR